MKKVLLVLLSIVVIAAAWGIMFVTDVNRGVFQSSFAEEVLETVPAAEFTRQLLAQQLFAELPGGTPPVVKQELPTAFLVVFDEPWADSVLRTASRDIISTIKGEQESLNSVFDIKERKELMFDQLMVQLSALSDRELADGGLPRMALGLTSSMLREQILSGIPDQLSLEALLVQAGGDINISELQQEYLRAQRRYRIGLIINIPLLVVLFILLAGSIGAMRWIGWSLIISGAVYLGAFLIFRGMAPTEIIETALSGMISSADISSVISMTVNKFLFLPMAVTGIGVILTAVSIFLPRRESA